MIQAKKSLLLLAAGMFVGLCSVLATAVSTDEQTKAHRANLVFLIDKALSVK